MTFGNDFEQNFVDAAEPYLQGFAKLMGKVSVVNEIKNIFPKNPMYNIKFTLIENSKSKGIKKGIIIILSLVSLIISAVCLGGISAIEPVFLVFGSMAFIISFVIFYDSYKTYNIVGYLKLESDIITINQMSKSLIIKTEEIRYFDFEYKGYTGSYSPGDMLAGTIVSNSGTGNLLEIATKSNIYKLNILIGDERSAAVLKNYIIKFNKSKQIKNV